jgi:hypothetical protein
VILEVCAKALIMSSAQTEREVRPFKKRPQVNIDVRPPSMLIDKSHSTGSKDRTFPVNEPSYIISWFLPGFAAGRKSALNRQNGSGFLPLLRLSERFSRNYLHSTLAPL